MAADRDPDSCGLGVSADSMTAAPMGGHLSTKACDLTQITIDPRLLNAGFPSTGDYIPYLP